MKNGCLAEIPGAALEMEGRRGGDEKATTVSGGEMGEKKVMGNGGHIYTDQANGDSQLKSGWGFTCPKATLSVECIIQ